MVPAPRLLHFYQRMPLPNLFKNKRLRVKKSLFTAKKNRLLFALAQRRSLLDEAS